MNDQIFDFGYPAAGKYHGYDLTYCSDQVFYDANNGNNTLGIDCDMTGGSSGGPWLTGFSTTSGVGTLRSVNSYGYSSIRNKEYGPKFNGNTVHVQRGDIGDRLERDRHRPELRHRSRAARSAGPSGPARRIRAPSRDVPSTP